MKHNSHVSTLEADEVADCTGLDLGCDGNNIKADTLRESADNGSRVITELETPTEVKDLKEVDEAFESNGVPDNKSAAGIMDEEHCEPIQVDSKMTAKEPGCLDDFDGTPGELPHRLDSARHEVESHFDKLANFSGEDLIIENKLMTLEESKLEGTDGENLGPSTELDSCPGLKSDITGKNSEKGVRYLEDMFEAGSVLVEYGRTEASCTAAHCLHGRCFDGRAVVAGYVPLDLYRMKFPR